MWSSIHKNIILIILPDRLSERERRFHVMWNAEPSPFADLPLLSFYLNASKNAPSSIRGR